MDDANLSGLDLAAAKEYIFAYAVDVKRLDKEIADSNADLERWKARLALAEGRLGAGDGAMAALVQAARSKIEETADKGASLRRSGPSCAPASPGCAPSCRRSRRASGA